MAEHLGYARVSTSDQNPDLQLDALRAAGVTRIWTEHASGALAGRPQLDELLATAGAGDTIVIWKLDRLARGGLSHLIATVQELTGRGVELRSLTEGIDTATPAGRMLLGIFGTLAAFERDLLIERTIAGQEAARRRGRRPGRPTVMTPERIEAAREMIAAGHNVTRTARTLGVSRPSLYRALASR